MEMKRQYLLILVIFIALIIALGCGKKEQAAASEETQEEAAERWKIGMSQCNLGEPWRVQMNQDIKNEAAKHPEIRVVYKDAQNDSLKQRAQIEEFIINPWLRPMKRVSLLLFSTGK
jgi:ribose transport system substrate-binding protein